MTATTLHPTRPDQRLRPTTPDRSGHDATGRACGSAGDLVYGAGMQVCLPLQVLASVSVRVRASARASLSMPEVSDRQRAVVTAAAEQIGGGPWEMSKIAVNSWFLPRAGMLEDAATAAAAARAILAATESPATDETISEIVHRSVGHGAGLALPGLTVTENDVAVHRHRWVPHLFVVSVIPTRTDRTPQPMPALTGSRSTAGVLRDLAEAVTAQDTDALIAVAEQTAGTSGHPSLTILDELAGLLGSTGLTPVGRIVSHQGPTVGLLYPADDAGRQNAYAATYLIATHLQDTVRVNCARTTRYSHDDI